MNEQDSESLLRYIRSYFPSKDSREFYKDRKKDFNNISLTTKVMDFKYELTAE